MASGGDGYRGALVCAVLAVCISAVVSAPARAQLCAGAADDDPRTASFCQALNTFFELYAEAAGEQVPEYQGTVHKLRRGKRDMYTEDMREFDRMLNQLTEEQWQTLVRDYPQLLDTGMKRQDVVHSFLRFGRRR